MTPVILTVLLLTVPAFAQTTHSWRVIPTNASETSDAHGLLFELHGFADGDTTITATIKPDDGPLRTFTLTFSFDSHWPPVLDVPADLMSLLLATEPKAQLIETRVNSYVKNERTGAYR